MAYALASLMTIRERRENAARGELVASRHKVAEAQSELESRINDLREFERTKDDRRDRIYDSIMGRTLSLDDLAFAQEGVSRIDEEGNLKADNVVRAEDVLKERKKDEASAHDRFVVATKNKMKIEERAAAEKRKASFQMVIDDVYAIGKGRLVGRPKY